MTKRSGHRLVAGILIVGLAQVGFASLPAFSDDLTNPSVSIDFREAFAGDMMGVEPVPEHELAQLRGTGFLDFLSSLISVLPEENTVAINVDGFSDESSGSGTQTLSFSSETTTVFTSASSSTSTTTISMSTSSSN